MACGDRYRLEPAFMAATSPSEPWSKGRSWDDPWSLSPGPIDYALWKSAAERATDRMYAAIEQLGAIEKELGRGYAKWNELQPAAAEIFNRRNELPNALFTVDMPRWAPDAVQIVRDAACELEKIDDAIAAYGRKPSTATGGGGSKPGGFLDSAMPYAIVALIIGGAYYLDSKSADEE